MKKGIYDFMGNTVEYEGGDYAYDLDRREDLELEMLEAFGIYIMSLEKFYEEHQGVK